MLLAQDHVLGRTQALEAGVTRNSIEHRLKTRQWQRMLPSVYLTAPTEPSRRQMLVAALVYAGPQSAIDDVDACRFHGLRNVVIDELVVHVVVPGESAARSRGFVVVRRTDRPIVTVATERLRYVDAATAVVIAARGMRRDRAVVAAISEALQRRVTTYDELVRVHVQGPPRGARIVGRALASLGTGAASVPEVDFLTLVAISPILPPPLCNVLLRLPCGRLISPDALFLTSGLVHETNGRQAHARADLFEDMQERHDAMTAAGLTVLHNSPRRLLTAPREVLGEVERCHSRLDGRGLPEGITIVANAG
ncbi:MAG TPA: hypothetical protein VHW92_00505 [Mycobacteriales bacterium]|nr:hypothetical protein [Mycobacteriales bacterium]